MTRFDSIMYELYNNGRKPRGVGVWGFSETCNPTTEQMFFSPKMTLTQAKRWGRKTRKCAVLYILP